MSRFVLAVTVVAFATLVLAGTSLARVPDPTKCEVSDCMINTCPIVHAQPDASERDCVLTVTLYNENFDPVEGFPAGNFSFDVQPHSAYPGLGGGPSGDCAGCEGHYTVTCIDPATNAAGDMTVLVDLGTGCAPSMCCPVEVWVIIPQGTISDPGGVDQNSVDMATASTSGGIVDLSDIAAFSAAIAGWNVNTILQQCGDFVIAAGQTNWGEIGLEDIAMFSAHINNSCTPFVDPCP